MAQIWMGKRVKIILYSTRAYSSSKANQLLRVQSSDQSMTSDIICCGQRHSFHILCGLCIQRSYISEVSWRPPGKWSSLRMACGPKTSPCRLEIRWAICSSSASATGSSSCISGLSLRRSSGVCADALVGRWSDSAARGFRLSMRCKTLRQQSQVTRLLELPRRMNKEEAD